MTLDVLQFCHHILDYRSHLTLSFLKGWHCSSMGYGWQRLATTVVLPIFLVAKQLWYSIQHDVFYQAPFSDDPSTNIRATWWRVPRGDVYHAGFLVPMKFRSCWSGVCAVFSNNSSYRKDKNNNVNAFMVGSWLQEGGKRASLSSLFSPSERGGQEESLP